MLTRSIRYMAVLTYLRQGLDELENSRNADSEVVGGHDSRSDRVKVRAPHQALLLDRLVALLIIQDQDTRVGDP